MSDDDGRFGCIDFSPPWFVGRWRDWHRGHGCDKDDGKPRTAEGAAEIAAGPEGVPPDMEERPDGTLSLRKEGDR